MADPYLSDSDMSDASRKRERSSSSEGEGDAQGPARRARADPPAAELEQEPDPYGLDADLDAEADADALLPSEDEGENLVEAAERDYRGMEHLDAYNDAMLDPREYEEMLIEQRLAAEEEIDQRRRQRADRLAQLLGSDDEEDQEDRARRRRREDAAEGGEDGFDDDDEDLDEEVNLEQFDVPLREWVATDRTRREIKRRFARMLKEFVDDRRVPVYVERIHEMCAANEQSLVVSYMHVSHSDPTLAIWLADAPRDLLEVFDEVALDVVLELYPNYARIHREVFVRVEHLPCHDSLRDLREIHLDSLVSVTGVVTRRTGVFPQLKHVKFNCPQCRTVIGPFEQRTDKEVRPRHCPECQSHGPFSINAEETVYRNYQKIALQESPGSVPPGRVPRHREVILLADLIDSARPGEEVNVLGIYTHSRDMLLNSKQGFPVFATVIEANNVIKKHDLHASHALTEEDKAAVLALSRDPNIGRRIVESIAPSIYGHEHVKMSLAFSLFGGRAKDMNKKHRIRGDVNVLLLGDPGTAKSQFLKYAEKTAPRAVYTTGKGASAVGLTASVQKDPITKEWTLEGGALVLADRGVCLIDEFDKMNESDRTSIHEAMEQQSISISKAGIVTSLQARCSIIAAANPIGGRYDGSRTLAENVELTDPILQRFDVLCVLQDTVDPVADERLAEFVVGSHMRSHPLVASAVAAGALGEEGAAAAQDQDEPAQQAAQALAQAAQAAPAPETIPQDLLRKYITYARQFVKPQLHNIDQDKIARLYADLRRESITSGGVPIAVRHIESIMRMSEAHARMHLRDHVRSDDVDTAIRVMLESFIQAQKFQVKRSLRRGFAKFLTFQRDHDELLLHALQALVRDAHKYLSMRHRRDVDTVEVRAADLEARARELEIFDVQPFYRSRVFSQHNFVYDAGTGVITKAF